MPRPLPRLLALIALFLLPACQPFEYTPSFDGDRGKPRHNLANIERIAATGGGPRGQGRIAVLADIHQAYDELKTAVARLNADTTLDFVIVLGDLTNYGYAREYRWLADLLEKLRAPAIVVIGNHDVQAEGRTLYQRIYGPTDFSFAWRGYWFVLFDDNAREYEGDIPDWDWLERTLDEAGDSLRVIPVCHAPPYTDQLDETQSARLVDLYSRHQAALVIGSHSHRYAYGELHGGGVPYLAADNLEDRNYVVVTLDSGRVAVERVFF